MKQYANLCERMIMHKVNLRKSSKGNKKEEPSAFKKMGIIMLTWVVLYSLDPVGRGFDDLLIKCTVASFFSFLLAHFLLSSLKKIKKTPKRKDNEEWKQA